ncbi:hypothetical protein C3L29_032740, partial [Pseudomonas sp. MWU12-2534b]
WSRGFYSFRRINLARLNLNDGRRFPGAALLETEMIAVVRRQRDVDHLVHHVAQRTGFADLASTPPIAIRSLEGLLGAKIDCIFDSWRRR